MDRTGIANRIKSARSALNLTQTALALESKIPLTILNKVETGFQELRIPQAIAISAATKCDLEWLLTGRNHSDGIAPGVDREFTSADIVFLLVDEVSDIVGFKVTEQQALEWLTRKAGIHDKIFPGINLARTPMEN